MLNLRIKEIRKTYSTLLIGLVSEIIPLILVLIP